ncbi:MAG: 16S rRNA (adenine(1518)-N(6)/adenine(1519)-N(6))-dimethyltransferase RsmA [Bacteroidota bacterium]
MGAVRAKKHLGQHFLNDAGVAQRIVESLENPEGLPVLEIGPGTGVLTQFLIQDRSRPLYLVEVDQESVAYLQATYPSLGQRLLYEDFLRMDLERFGDGLTVIGNFPYNISSQILFKVYETRARIPEVVGMFQKEVAERIASPPGSKNYGILSVLLQAFYRIDYLFTVDRTLFNPPPKVQSGVIRLERLPASRLDCDAARFRQVVKQAFNQRRKTLRNSLRSLIGDRNPAELPLFQQRPEALTVESFSALTNWLFPPNDSPS